MQAAPPPQSYYRPTSAGSISFLISAPRTNPRHFLKYSLLLGLVGLQSKKGHSRRLRYKLKSWLFIPKLMTAEGLWRGGEYSCSFLSPRKYWTTSYLILLVVSVTSSMVFPSQLFCSHGTVAEGMRTSNSSKLFNFTEVRVINEPLRNTEKKNVIKLN